MFRLQQYGWGFRLYDVELEEPAENEITSYSVTEEQADWIQQGAEIQIIDGVLVVLEPVEVSELEEGDGLSQLSL
jgi:hypothetical protein